MALMQLTVIPMGTSEPGVGDYVLAIQKKLEEKGAVFRLNDMGTLVEGEPKYLLHLAASIYETPFEQGAIRVVTQISIDDRRDKDVHIGDKILSVIRRDP